MKICFSVIPIFVLLSFCSISVCAQDIPPPYLKRYSKGVPPVGPVVQFEHDGSLPPKPKGRQITNRQLDLKKDDLVRTDEQVRSLRQTAERVTSVEQVLGSRFAFITSGTTELAKGLRPATSKPLTTLRYYSYSNNRAYEVQMSGDEVARVIPKRKGHQPPASREEVEAAAELVKTDARFKSDVAGLFVRGILTPSENGNRHLDLLFYKGQGLKRGPAVFEATVDMTAAKIISAEPVKR